MSLTTATTRQPAQQQQDASSNPATPIPTSDHKNNKIKTQASSKHWLKKWGYTFAYSTALKGHTRVMFSFSNLIYFTVIILRCCHTYISHLCLNSDFGIKVSKHEQQKKWIITAEIILFLLMENFFIRSFPQNILFKWKST